MRRAKALMGDQGVVAVYVTYSSALTNDEDVYRYYENPDKHGQRAAERVAQAERRFEYLMSLDVRPDVISVGGSGTLVYQTVEIFRQLAFPAVRSPRSRQPCCAPSATPCAPRRMAPTAPCITSPTVIFAREQ